MKKLIIIVLLLSVVFGCGNNQSSKNEIKPIVTVSILPQKYFIDRITNGKIDVNVMVPEGNDPHTYEPSAKQMQNLSNSSAYFRMGYIEFEQAWMTKFEALNPKMKIVDLSINANLIMPEESHDHDHESDHHHHEGVDPHIWSSPVEAKKMCNIIFSNLTELYPQYNDEFTANYNQLNREIDSLDLYIKTQLDGLETRKFMIYHSALAYFARDYQLEQVAVEVDGKEPTPLDIKNIIELAKKENIKVIFVQKQFNTHNAEVLSNEIKGKVVQVDPLGYDWMEITKKIADEIALIYTVK
ncbi:MAG: metal ABC transporter solute-binding protein, Zn/Mn family [Bacteroidales bacterium]